MTSRAPAVVSSWQAASTDGPTGIPDGPARLEVRDLRVTFGGVRAVDDVSFSAEPGAIVGLIGANGSGKTTTLDMISGLVSPDHGTVELDGVDLAEYMPEERARIGMIRSFQDCRLFPELTVVRRAHALRGRQARGVGALHHPAAAVGAPAPSVPSVLRSTR